MADNTTEMQHGRPLTGKERAAFEAAEEIAVQTRDDTQDAILCVACELGAPASDARHSFREVCDLSIAPMLERVHHDPTDYCTIIRLRDFDIGIDPCDCGRGLECGGLRVFVYDGRYGETTETHGPSFALHYRSKGRGNFEPADPRTGSPFIWKLTASADSVHVVFNSGAALYVSDGHVFGYFTDDGGACEAIVHTAPATPDCNEMGCDPELVRAWD